jgi:hypothetical protein
MHLQLRFGERLYPKAIMLHRCMYENIYKLSGIFKAAITRWKQENKQEVLEEARSRNLIITSKDFKNFFEKVSKIPGMYMRFDDDVRGSFLSPRITHNYRGLYGWNMYGQTLADIISLAFGAFKRRKYIYVFKVKDPSSILKAEDYTEQMLKNDLDKVKGMFPNLAEFIDEMNQNFSSEHPFTRLEAILQDAMAQTDRPKMEGAIDPQN